MSKKFVRSLSLILVLSMLFVLSAIAAPAALAEGTEEEVIEEEVVEEEIEEEEFIEEEVEEVVVPSTGDFSANVALTIAASLLVAGAAAAFVAKKQH